MSRIIIENGRVIDPSQKLDRVTNLLIDGGRIGGIDAVAADSTAMRIDAAGRIVTPGLIDMHVHLREPGREEDETIESGTAAALAGGFTSIACIPNTDPPIDTQATVEFVQHQATLADRCNVFVVACVSKNREGKELAEIGQLVQAGAVAFSDDGSPVKNPRLLRQAALYARDVPGVFISHCEDADLKGDAVMNEGVRSVELGLAGAPGLAEDVNVARDVLIGGDTGKPFHIAHLSTAMSVELIRFGRAHEIGVTCEVTPHHLLLGDDRFESFRADAKVNPPLRLESDIAALRSAVRDGTIDAFATDHAPHTREEKAQLLDAAPVGFSGLETALGAYAAALPELPLSRFVALLSTNPARILGVAGGTLRVGSAADVTIFAERPWRVDASTFYSLGKNTPFDGVRFSRRAIATIVDGAFAMRDGRVVESQPAR